MRQILLTMFVLGATAVHLHAQGANLGLIKQRAREVTGQQQKAAPASPGGSSASSASSSSTTTATATDGVAAQALQRVTADFAVIKFRSEVTPDLNQKFSKDLIACLKTPIPTQQDAVTKLAGELTAALIGKQVPTDLLHQFAQELAMALYGGATPAVLATAKDTLTKMELPADTVASLVKSFEAAAGPPVTKAK